METTRILCEGRICGLDFCLVEHKPEGEQAFLQLEAAGEDFTFDNEAAGNWTCHEDANGVFESEEFCNEKLFCDDAVDDWVAARRKERKDAFENAADNYYREHTEKTFDQLDREGYFSYGCHNWADGLTGAEWESVEEAAMCGEEAATQVLEKEI